MAEQYERRKAAGQCTRCGTPERLPRGLLCATCQDRKRRADQRYYRRWRPKVLAHVAERQWQHWVAAQPASHVLMCCGTAHPIPQIPFRLPCCGRVFGEIP